MKLIDYPYRIQFRKNYAGDHFVSSRDPLGTLDTTNRYITPVEAKSRHFGFQKSVAIWLSCRDLA